MSWQAMDAVDRLPYDLVKPLAYRVLVKLANVAAQDGTRAFRSKWEMADELGVSERSIQRALQELEMLGVIRKGDQKYTSHLRGGNRPTVYDVVMHYTPRGVQSFDDGLTEAQEAGETRGETEISTGPRGETRGETTAVAHRELRELTTHHEEISLDPAARAREALRAMCAPPYRTHEFAPNGTCIHGCGVYADGHIEDPRTGLTILEAVRT